MVVSLIHFVTVLRGRFSKALTCSVFITAGWSAKSRSRPSRLIDVPIARCMTTL